MDGQLGQHGQLGQLGQLGRVVEVVEVEVEQVEQVEQVVVEVEQVVEVVEEPICTRPRCQCYLSNITKENEWQFHPSKEFEKCTDLIKKAYSADLKDLEDNKYIFKLCPSYKFSEGEINHLNTLKNNKINELKGKMEIAIIEEYIRKIERLGDRVTCVSESNVHQEQKRLWYDNIMTAVVKLTTDHLALTGETLPKPNDQGFLHAAGTIEELGGRISRIRELKSSISRDKMYKKIMTETIQFIANYLDYLDYLDYLARRQLPSPTIK